MRRTFIMLLLSVLYLSSFQIADAAPSDDTFIYVNLWKNRVYLKNEQGDILFSARVAPGAKDTPSPIGIFRVKQKSKDWGGGFGTRWLGLNVSWGIYGIHGTNRPEFIGRYVSHGCFRMHNRDIEKLYPQVKVGTRVIIDGPIIGHEDIAYILLVPGSRGALVQMVQNRLKAAGYYTGSVHGKYDRATELAVIRFQKKEGFKITGHIHFTELQYLGVIE